MTEKKIKIDAAFYDILMPSIFLQKVRVKDYIK